MSLKHKAILKHIPNKHFQTTTNMYSTLQIISIVLLFRYIIIHYFSFFYDYCSTYKDDIVLQSWRKIIVGALVQAIKFA